MGLLKRVTNPNGERGSQIVEHRVFGFPQIVGEHRARVVQLATLDQRENALVLRDPRPLKPLLVGCGREHEPQLCENRREERVEQRTAQKPHDMPVKQQAVGANCAPVSAFDGALRAADRVAHLCEVVVFNALAVR